MTNFLNETIEAINQSGHTPSDIVFIGSEASGHECTWGQFQKIADHKYDSGFGGQEVASDLIIVFSDGQQMFRGEYDGSEWWEFISLFARPKESHAITNLFAEIGWKTLNDLSTTTGTPEAVVGKEPKAEKT